MHLNELVGSFKGFQQEKYFQECVVSGLVLDHSRPLLCLKGVELLLGCPRLFYS